MKQFGTGIILLCLMLAAGCGGGADNAGTTRVASVSVSPQAVTIAAGDTAQLAATIAPADAADTSVAWSSGNAAIATVSATGQIRGISEGVTDITVTTTDGGHTAHCTVTVSAVVADQIIADHTIVADYTKIPAQYITAVKAMWINIVGESHSEAYRAGLDLLAAADARFAVDVTDGGTPPAATTLNLRSNRAFYINSSYWAYGTGESTWYTNATGIAAVKNHITQCNTRGLDLSAIGFGWCWDTTWQNAPGGTVDPVYKVRWAGSSEGGPHGNLRWGLDAGDEALTGNSVCMDTYLNATEEYRLYCKSNAYATKVLFTTSPVDGYTGESGYQRYLKHEHIRAFVQANAERILFDYADILCYNDAGAINTTSWTDGDGGAHQYPVIHDDNLGDGDIGHIGSGGALRLAKAQWWLLARLAGWNGN